MAKDGDKKKQDKEAKGVEKGAPEVDKKQEGKGAQEKAKAGKKK
eukprot:CAMPEP_0185838360 /NCGR_PEP_ID=MMETSP1353-20130828/12918_1 /TAXON_ID=1077150 /ORGANISM="Erythrolobus australicus, Strain CCMP3124" /LENGTH=43 /DNA_ID= /DNA_START= /DNA_END= /DNA_ORIENTATION=